jgi:non-homologous end joining protein Ku
MCGEGNRARTTIWRAAVRDRCQDALRELIGLKGRIVAAKPVTPTAPVVDLMSALTRSSAQQAGEPAAKETEAQGTADRRQSALLFAGGRRRRATARGTEPL